MRTSHLCVRVVETRNELVRVRTYLACSLPLLCLLLHVGEARQDPHPSSGRVGDITFRGAVLRHITWQSDIADFLPQLVMQGKARTNDSLVNS